MKKLQPKHVDDNKLYSREEATKAMGVSTVSFSKYFALGGGEHFKYRGVYLNRRIDELTGKTDEVKITNVKMSGQKLDIPMRNIIVNGYKPDGDVAYLVKPTSDGYIAGGETLSTIVKAKKREGVYTKYIMPIVKVWMHEDVKPDIVLIDLPTGGDIWQSDFSRLWYFVNTARENSYNIGNFNDLLTDQLTILDKNSEMPNFLYLPAFYRDGHFDKASSAVNSRSVRGILDMIFSVRSVDYKKPLKVIINDVSTNVMANKEMQDLVQTFCSIGAGLDIEITIATDKMLDGFDMCRVVNGVKKWRFDADLAKMMEK